uniref:prosaposin-like n=1 Tax=Pristiophorus japonicus TaxID=55135 RepID=UPI00398F032C
MAALVILALLCVSPVLANSEPKDEACAEGEDYWCQNLRTAIECEAVQHCVQTTWSQPTAENDICDVCKKFIAQVADLVKDKSLQDAVKDALHKGCALIPIKEFADQCNDYVDSYLPLIIQFIENELDPSVVCVALGLCKSQQPIQAHEILSNAIPEDEPRVANPSRLHTAARVHQQKPLANDLPQCEFCLLLMEKLEELLPKEQTESAIIHVLDQLCSHLPSKYSAKCQNFVDTYGKTAIDLLFKQLGPHAVCIALKLCFMEAKSFGMYLNQH